MASVEHSGPSVQPAVASTINPNWRDGGMAPLTVNPTTGALKTEVSGAGSGGTSATDGNGFTAGASAGTPMMGEDGTLLKIAVLNSFRDQIVQLARSSDGAEVGTLANPIRTQEVGGGGSAVTLADGANVVEGAVADTKVVGDNSGTLSAKLRGLNTTLTSVDGKTPALGQALAASSIPVVLTAAQITTLTPVSAVTATLAAETTKVIGTVNVAASQTIATTNAGTFAVQATPVTQADTFMLGGVNVKEINAVTPLMGAGNTGTGSLRVTVASDQASLPVNATLKSATSGGYTTYHLVSAASTNLTNIKASAGQVYGWYIYNSNAAARKLVFHNTAGTPTAGASVFFSLMIPPTSAANVFTDVGIPFSTGIGISTVTGLADNDTVAVALNDLMVNIFYA